EVVVAGGASVGSSAVVGSAVGGTNLVKASDKRTSNKRPNNKRPLEFNNSLTFSNINFRYKDDVPLIDNLNVHIPKGKKVAIVGPTGGGKTTLVNLLMRFYDAQSGQILIDDTNIYECDRNSVRDLFGMVLQDVWLFNGTIRDNITYGKEGASETQIEAACKKAHIDRFINTLPDGYETIINEDATNISQGQKQLITIARAFLANKPILILDEATSNVDTLTEALVQDAMRELLKHKTSFVIAHRLSTIVDSDLILVINNGQIIEQGTHHSLLSAGGFYAELYNSQFAM
ncbi:MAG: ATP-binding cassette domain-containing protein, partial [Firmicutes bacterium]|nr:ATP-binding cassette domain-containing protein [Bacillota bacterium]